MIKVLVVDDERLVRKGLVSGVDWHSLGCMVVGEAENGMEGMECFYKCNPDLIITDIRMPKMDGIQMITELRENNVDMDVIFLTAYNEFSYAQKAIKLLAADYILKPFEDGELEESVLRIKDMIIDKKKNNKDVDKIEIQVKSGEKSGYVIEAMDYIRDNYYDFDLSVDSIAEILDISGSHLSRTFKKETDYTVLSYITQYRIRKAKVLLSDYRNKVYEVSSLVGYRDNTYFSSIFKKITGISPSEYQACNREISEKSKQ